MTEHGDRERTVRFLRDFAVRTAGRAEELPYGVAVLNAALPSVWDLNFLWADTVPARLTAEGLAGEAERLQGAAGLAHRQIVVAHERGGERLVPGLRALGWETKRRVLMAHRRPPDRAADFSLVREVGEAAIRALAEASLRRDPTGFPEETIRQITGQKPIAAAAGARFFGVERDGAVVSGCDLYPGGGVAQIEAVITLEEHRNRGLARAVVLRALAEARASGCGLVFLQAEEDDWPRELYTRLGFDRIGFTHVFLRKVHSA